MKEELSSLHPSSFRLHPSLHRFTVNFERDARGALPGKFGGAAEAGLLEFAARALVVEEFEERAREF